MFLWRGNTVRAFRFVERDFQRLYITLIENARGAHEARLPDTPVSSCMDLSSLFRFLSSGAINSTLEIDEKRKKMRLHYLVSLFIRFVHSVEVTPNSNCFWVCVDDIGTSDITDKFTTKASTDQIVCGDYQLSGQNSTAKGKKWRECLTCELSSGSVDPFSGESDILWIICKSPSLREDDCG